MNKPVKIKFLTEKLEKEYLDLSENAPLKKKINSLMNKLKESPSFGQPIAKRLIPKEYLSLGIKSTMCHSTLKGGV